MGHLNASLPLSNDEPTSLNYTRAPGNRCCDHNGQVGKFSIPASDARSPTRHGVIDRLEEISKLGSLVRFTDTSVIIS